MLIYYKTSIRNNYIINYIYIEKTPTLSGLNLDYFISNLNTDYQF